MRSLIKRFATPLTTGFFAISMVSGVALFFHWLPAAFHAMHEWLSLVLLLPVGFHVWKNWSSLLNYARRGALLVPLALALVVALPFAAPALTGAGGGNPAFRALPLMTQAPLSDLAPVLKTTPDALVQTLEARGYTVASPDQPLDAVAETAGVPANEILFAVMPEE